MCKLNFNLISLEKYVQITFISHPTLMPLQVTSLQVKSVHTKCTDFTYTTPRNGKVNLIFKHYLIDGVTLMDTASLPSSSFTKQQE